MYDTIPPSRLRRATSLCTREAFKVRGNYIDIFLCWEEVYEVRGNYIDIFLCWEEVYEVRGTTSISSFAGEKVYEVRETTPRCRSLMGDFVKLGGPVARMTSALRGLFKACYTVALLNRVRFI